MKEKKSLKQIISFLAVGLIAGLIQLVLVNLLYFALQGWTAPLPGLLSEIFSERTVGEGHAVWGYVLPFFASNLIANIAAYFLNKKRTFGSDAPKRNLVIFICIIVCLILFSTWLQGVVANAIIRGGGLLAGLAPTAAMCCASTFQSIVLFPLEKFVLLKEKAGGAAGK